MKQQKTSHHTKRVIADISLRVGEPDHYEVVAPNTPVEMDLDEANALIKKGLAFDVTTTEGLIRENMEVSQPVESPMGTIEDRIDAIVDAIADLNPEDFGKDDKPSVKAIEKLLGENVSASERDQAWVRYQHLADDGA